MDMGQVCMADSAFTPAIEHAWINLVRAEEAVVAAVEAEVKAAGLPPLAWYDVLIELSRPRSERGVRQNELERRLLFRQYNLSRLIDRLEEAKYVERQPCPEDGRGQVVVATAAGKKFQKQMWPVYRDAVAKRVANKLTNKEAAELGRLLEKLVGGANAAD
jgi:DNA-binding MarR family transcriptional regulator